MGVVGGSQGLRCGLVSLVSHRFLMSIAGSSLLPRQCRTPDAIAFLHAFAPVGRAVATRHHGPNRYGGRVRRWVELLGYAKATRQVLEGVGRPRGACLRRRRRPAAELFDPDGLVFGIVRGNADQMHPASLASSAIGDAPASLDRAHKRAREGTCPCHVARGSFKARGHGAVTLLNQRLRFLFRDLGIYLKDAARFRQQAYLEGAWVDADSGATFEVSNPPIGAVLCAAPVGAREHDLCDVRRGWRSQSRAVRSPPKVTGHPGSWRQRAIRDLLARPGANSSSRPGRPTGNSVAT
jgi:hypothetical protein